MPHDQTALRGGMPLSGLPARDREAILSRYQARFSEFGPSVAALASGNEAKQKIRHQVLSEVGNLEGSAVLDAGCGLGHMLGFLAGAGISVSYTGVDLVPEFIDHCQTAFSGLQPAPTFIAGDLLGDAGLLESLPEVDYAFASQVFNNRYEGIDNWTVLESAIAQLFAKCTRGLAIDCLTTWVDFEEPRLFYYDPARLLAYGLSLTRRAVLRHDYPLYEQTLYLYRS